MTANKRVNEVLGAVAAALGGAIEFLFKIIGWKYFAHLVIGVAVAALITFGIAHYFLQVDFSQSGLDRANRGG